VPQVPCPYRTQTNASSTINIIFI